MHYLGQGGGGGPGHCWALKWQRAKRDLATGIIINFLTNRQENVKLIIFYVLLIKLQAG
jgi:hypothetical protein